MKKHNSGCKMYGTHFTNKATGHNKVLLVAELSSSVPCRTTAPLLPTALIRNYPIPYYYTKAMITDYEVFVVTSTANHRLHTQMDQASAKKSDAYNTKVPGSNSGKNTSYDHWTSKTFSDEKQML
jgi:hypothetical protein